MDDVFGGPRDGTITVWAEPQRVTVVRTVEAPEAGDCVNGEIITTLGGPAIATACALGAVGVTPRCFVPVAPEDSTAVASTLSRHGVAAHMVPGPPLPITVVLVSPSGRSTVTGPPGGPPAADSVPSPWGGVLHLDASSLTGAAAESIARLIARSRARLSITFGTAHAVDTLDVRSWCQELRPAFVFAYGDAPAALGDRVREHAGCYVSVSPEQVATMWLHGAPRSVAERLEDPEPVVHDGTGADDALVAGVLAAWKFGTGPDEALEFGQALALTASRSLGPLLSGELPRIGSR